MLIKIYILAVMHIQT